MILQRMSDKLAAIIGGGGILATITVELINAYVALAIGLLTMGILFPKFLVAVPKAVALLRSGLDGFIRRMRNGRDTDPEL